MWTCFGLLWLIGLLLKRKLAKKIENQWWDFKKWIVEIWWKLTKLTKSSPNVKTCQIFITFKFLIEVSENCQNFSFKAQCKFI